MRHFFSSTATIDDFRDSNEVSFCNSVWTCLMLSGVMPPVCVLLWPRLIEDQGQAGAGGIKGVPITGHEENRRALIDQETDAIAHILQAQSQLHGDLTLHCVLEWN